MEKQYKTLKELVQETGVMDALKIKFLELRDRYHLFNSLCSEGILYHINSEVFHKNYIAFWNEKGKLVYFNPRPNYPEDFRSFSVLQSRF